MRRVVLASILCLLCGSATAADDAYKFHVSVVTAREARQIILGRPEPPAAATDTPNLVMLFEGRGGTHWKATASSCSKTLSECEILINSQGSAGAKKNSDKAASVRPQYDLGFALNADGMVRAHCLKPACSIRFSTTDETWTDISLRFDQWHDLPLPVDIEVSFASADVRP